MTTGVGIVVGAVVFVAFVVIHPLKMSAVIMIADRIRPLNNSLIVGKVHDLT